MRFKKIFPAGLTLDMTLVDIEIVCKRRNKRGATRSIFFRGRSKRTSDRCPRRKCQVKVETFDLQINFRTSELDEIWCATIRLSHSFIIHTFLFTRTRGPCKDVKIFVFFSFSCYECNSFIRKFARFLFPLPMREKPWITTRCSMRLLTRFSPLR